MEKGIKNIILKYGLSRKRVILAVSGGVDSVVLLDLMAKYLSKDNLYVVHANHGLRKEAGKDEEFVRECSAKYGLPCYSAKLKLAKGDEQTARNGRYRYLKNLKRKLNAEYIITAHHLNDQAETVLLNLIRGSGPLEVWGMKEVEGGLLRPLLSFSREEIENYAKKNKLEYVEDSSNYDKKYSRNRVRHLIIPEILKINPGFLKTLKSNVALGHEFQEYVENEVNQVKGTRVEEKKLKKMPLFLRKEIIRRELLRLRGRGSEVYGKNVKAVLDILEKQGTKRTEIAGKVIESDGRYLSFGIGKGKRPKTVELPLDKRVNFGKFKFFVRIGKGKPVTNNILLPTSFSGNLKVRVWQPGDKIVTKFGTKKLQDVFVDGKIPKRKRDSWPVVTANKRIIWVPGLIAGCDAKKENKNLIIEVK